jgi:lantibiotic modifying enzyme
LLEEACNLAEFNPALAETDEKLDVIGGLAGTILGLLALYKEIKLEKLLEKAIVCGNTLLKKRFETKSGYRAWVTVGGKAACGFSHGAAGISFALLQLYGVTRVTSFREAANEAILYENSQFNPETGNWSHYSSTEELPVFWTTWCHGAPGIGLGRVGGLGQLDTPEIHENIKQALETTKNFGLQNLDHLCCGNFGRLDLYVYASETLNEPDYLKLARQQATALINRAGDRGGFRLFPDTAGDLFSPGFFQGSSGIGYQLLRLASPRKYPSALLWQ